MDQLFTPHDNRLGLYPTHNEMPLKILEQSDKMFKFVILRVLYNIDIG